MSYVVITSIKVTLVRNKCLLHIQCLQIITSIQAIPRGWNFFGNYSQVEAGRIVVVWDPAVSVFVYQASPQAVTCGIYIMAEQLSLTVTFVYAYNTAEE